MSYRFHILTIYKNSGSQKRGFGVLGIQLSFFCTYTKEIRHLHKEYR